jgi:hypothetical protein
MSAHALTAVAWRAPWLFPYQPLGEQIVQAVMAGATQPQALNAIAASHSQTWVQPLVRFVPQSDLPPGMAYERFIFERWQCPTREGLHDFFNGLAWLYFPLTKRRLNHLHVEQIAHTGIAPVRGPARDALTLFDENAALLRAPDALWDALARKDWRAVFGDLRPLWDESWLLLFGHALLEKLVYPRKQVTAHVYRAYPASDSIAEMDAWLAADLNADKLATKPFAHLPVLGVPHWWSGNEDPAFYDDHSVFRQARPIVST